MNFPNAKCLGVGLVGLQDHGLPDRSLALDILVATVTKSNHKLVFVMDASFDTLEDIFRAIRSTINLDVLIISARPESGILMQELKEAIQERVQSNLSIPYLIFGGQAAQSAPDLLQNIFLEAIICTQEVEMVIPNLLAMISTSTPLEIKERLADISHLTASQSFQMPAHISTERAIKAGGTVWVESSRGCLGNCSFCGLSNDKVASKWQARNSDDLFDELQYIIDRWNVNTFSLSDYSAFETEEAILSFVDSVKQRNLNIKFSCDMRLDTVRRMKNLLPDLYKAGLRQAFVGIESIVPREQKLYGKQHLGVEAIHYMESVGIRAIGGFITLQPLATREELYQQVIGLKESNILSLISTPLKTIRIYRGTRYESLCRSKGILGDLNKDMFTYQYHCIDPYVDIVREVIQYFDTSLKKVYFNNYVENKLRLSESDELSQGINVLANISKRVQETDYWLVYELSMAMLSAQSVKQAREQAIKIGLQFNKKRQKCYQTMADDYYYLLEIGFPYYRNAFQTFIGKYKSIEDFEPLF